MNLFLLWYLAIINEINEKIIFVLWIDKFREALWKNIRNKGRKKKETDNEYLFGLSFDNMYPIVPNLKQRFSLSYHGK